jgi:hypothetical protein
VECSPATSTETFALFVLPSAISRYAARYQYVDDYFGGAHNHSLVNVDTGHDACAVWQSTVVRPFLFGGGARAVLGGAASAATGDRDRAEGDGRAARLAVAAAALVVATGAVAAAIRSKRRCACGVFDDGGEGVGAKDDESDDDDGDDPFRRSGGSSRRGLTAVGALIVGGDPRSKRAGAAPRDCGDACARVERVGTDDARRAEDLEARPVVAVRSAATERKLLQTEMVEMERVSPSHMARDE